LYLWIGNLDSETMYDRDTLHTVFRTIVGVVAYGALLLGTLLACFGAFSQLKLLLGVALVYLAGWVAFRRLALVLYFSLFWMSALLIAWVTSPWLALVTAVDSLKPGTPRAVVLERLKPWGLHEGIPDSNGSNWVALKGFTFGPEAIALSFCNDRLQSAQLYWD
jgi:hypothetical protein